MTDNNLESRITRRNFLGRLAAGTGAFGVASTGMLSVLPAKASMLPSTKYEDHSKTSLVQPVKPPLKWDDSVDVVVVGGGGAGLCASIRARQKGASVICTEIMPHTGGSTKEATVAVAWGTRAQKRAGVPFDENYLFDWAMRDSDYTIDPDFVRLQIKKGSETIDWMEDLGMDWEVYTSEGIPMYHIPKNSFKKTRMLRTQGVVTDFLTSKAREMGINIMLKTRAVALVKDNGRIVGIKVEREGKIYFLQARKGVVLAGGGMSVNRAMLKEYVPVAYNGCASSYDLPPANGYVIRMGLGAGADMSGYNSVSVFDNSLPYFEKGYDFYRYLYMGDIQIARQPWLSVNAYAQRFMNEDLHGEGLSFTLQGEAQMKQPGGRTFIIFDGNYEKNLKDFDQDFCEIPLLPDQPGMKEWDQRICPNYWKDAIDKSIKLGFIKIDNSVEGLARQLGLDPVKFRETVDQYNGFCKTGKDKQFKKQKKYLHPVLKEPFYGIKVGAQIVATSCGLKVNMDFQVLDENKNNIPGLYAACHTAGGALGENNVSISMIVGDCNLAYSTGYVAGESAATLA